MGKVAIQSRYAEICGHARCAGYSMLELAVPCIGEIVPGGPAPRTQLNRRLSKTTPRTNTSKPGNLIIGAGP
jgi:hypothetical protein